MDATIGLRVRSGWSAAVVVAGSPGKPEVHLSTTVLQSDPEVPETKQPYHHGINTLEDDEEAISSRVAIVERETRAAIDKLIEETKSTGLAITTAGIVVGSIIEPERITNPHIRAHAFEGRVFWKSIEKALHAHQISSIVILEKSAYQRAAAALSCTEEEVTKIASLFGTKFRPWRAEQKLSTMGALVAMAELQSK